MKGIFISYRRQDTQSAAGRLADHLREQMPEVAIFRDIETIEPGVDFVDAIGRALESCGILLAIIGPRWATMTDAAGRRRLDDPNDYARLEIATALQRSDVRVIPVLVEGAEMPGSETLPEELKLLARRNAIELTDKRWEFDVSTLVETLRKALGIDPSPQPIRPKPTPPTPPAPTPTPTTARNWKKWAWGFGIMVLLGGIFQAMEQQSVTGAWQDAQGGKYKIMEQGGQVVFQGTSMYGPVAGAGVVQGKQFSFSYTVNGAPYQAIVQLSPDGHYLNGQYRSPTTGENGPVNLQRIE